MSLVGQDSWSPPNQALLDAMIHVQTVWWGGYVGGKGLYLNTPYPKSAWDLIKANHLSPLPIYVPKQSLTGEDPTACAKEAINLTVAAGMTGVVAVDSESSMASIMNFEAWLDNFCAAVTAEGWQPVTYAGAHYVGKGSLAWNVEWGQPWIEPAPHTALQYGPHNNGPGLPQTDSNNAHDSFAFAHWIGDGPLPMPTTLAAPICAGVVNLTNDGYWLVGRDGGIFAFGNVPSYQPNLVTPDSAREIIDAKVSPVGTGLYLFGADGGVFTYGDAHFEGSIPGIPVQPSNLPPEA